MVGTSFGIPPWGAPSFDALLAGGTQGGTSCFFIATITQCREAQGQ